MVHAIPNCGFSQSYVISGTDGLMVVDVGSIGAARDIERFISGHPGLSMKDVRFITATHFHIDHIGGMGTFLKKCPPSTEVLFHPLVREYVRGKRKLSLIRSWYSGFMPAAFWCTRYIKRLDHLCFESLSGIPIPGLRDWAQLPGPENRIRYFDLDLSPSSHPGDRGQTLLQTCPAGFDGWEVLETPGHTEDSLSFYKPSTREMICGDLVVNTLRRGPGRLNPFCWSREITKRTYRELIQTLSPEIIYPGHGYSIRHSQNALSAVETFD